MANKFNSGVRKFVFGSFMLMGSQSLLAETDHAAGIDRMASYLAAGMACASVTAQSVDQEAHQKILNLVSSLTNKTFIYNEEERDFIKDKALTLSVTIAKQPEFESKCITLARSLIE